MKLKITRSRCVCPRRGGRRGKERASKEGALIGKKNASKTLLRRLGGIYSTTPPTDAFALHALPPVQAGGVVGLPVPDTLVAAFTSAFALVSAAVYGGTQWELRNCEPWNLPQGTEAREKEGRLYTLGVVPIFLATPFFARATFRRELVPGKVWAFEQKQGIGLGLNTSVNVRMTVVKLEEEGDTATKLFVYNLIAPTRECVQLLRELGHVDTILLPTTTFEHKQFLSKFSKTFPKAKIVVAPGQYTYPLNLSNRQQGKAQELQQDENEEEGRGQGLLPLEIESLTLDLPPVGLSSEVRFSEVAVYHKSSKCLLVCDAVMHLSNKVPCPISKRDLLEWANDKNIAISGLRLLGLFGVREKWKEFQKKKKRDSVKNRDRVEMIEMEQRECDLGWQRMALTSLYFGQRDVLQPQQSFDWLAERRLFVPPVVATLVYGWEGKESEGENDLEIAREVAKWSQCVSQWPFATVIPAHFDVVDASPEDWTNAFTQWSSPSSPSVAKLDYPKADIQCLRDVRAFLRKVGVIFDQDSRPTI
jgi:hypothetical protein